MHATNLDAMQLKGFSALALLAVNCFVSRPVACKHPHYRMHCLLSSKRRDINA
jgi:hypothetical protein